MPALMAYPRSRSATAAAGSRKQGGGRNRDGTGEWRQCRRRGSGYRSRDHGQLTEVIEGGPLDAPIAGAKLHKMDRQEYAAEFPLEWALKDVDLAISAADGEAPPLLAALSAQWHAAVAAGYGRQDISAARLALASQNRTS
jgi:hypothetical protein